MIDMNATEDQLGTIRRRVLREIYERRMLLTSVRDRPEGWTLVSGVWSPFYFQLRLLSSFPETLRLVAKGLAMVLRNAAPHVDRLVGLAHAGVPIATALSLETGIPACHTRKLAGVRTTEDLREAIAAYGDHALVEGAIESGESLCIVDDLVTGLESKLVARQMVTSEAERRGLRDVRCDDILVVLDRQQGADNRAREAGLRLHALVRLVDEGLPILEDVMMPEEFAVIRDYLLGP